MEQRSSSAPQPLRAVPDRLAGLIIELAALLGLGGAVLTDEVGHAVGAGLLQRKLQLRLGTVARLVDHRAVPPDVVGKLYAGPRLDIQGEKRGSCPGRRGV